MFSTGSHLGAGSSQRNSSTSQAMMSLDRQWAKTPLYVCLTTGQIFPGILVLVIDFPPHREKLIYWVEERPVWWKECIYELLVDAEPLTYSDTTVKADIVPNHDIDWMHCSSRSNKTLLRPSRDVR